MVTANPWRTTVIILVCSLCACGDSPSAPIEQESPAAPLDQDFDDDGVLNETDTCPDDAEVINQALDLDGCPDSPIDLYEVVRTDVESFWTAVLAETEWPYSPITTFLGYTAPADSPCGLLPLKNAFYCPTDAGVYYDAGLLDNFLALVGDMAPAFIIGHEIGHHVSWLLGWTEPVITHKETELQADCFGGAWARSADDRGLLEEGDLEEAVVTLVTVGDPDYTWFSPDGHGTPQQRALAFALGYDGGASGCTEPKFFEAFPVSTR